LFPGNGCSKFGVVNKEIDAMNVEFLLPGVVGQHRKDEG